MAKHFWHGYTSLSQSAYSTVCYSLSPPPSQKNKSTPLWKFTAKIRTLKNLPRHISIRRKCCQHSTDDRGLFITLSVQLCVGPTTRLAIGTVLYGFVCSHWNFLNSFTVRFCTENL